ncbi:hypothetical protein C3O70_18315 [Cronobacter sakazakii]|uniref:hypothetical protein n=1 Tax=Cronobacter sakazakii TaxID=28141 RepID=UPI000F5D046E|nr:hypothetical protein [Cronobacter sakazakii]RRA27540.1 hypothetical protein C3O71_11005 [Cronobacter sakazakii]RRA30779.1 hypothetical protein C3O70_18315 [Cronobacter sakazakii]
MNEQANKILVDLLQKASNGIDAAVSFSQAQIPDVINQLLLWKAASSFLVFFIGLCLICFGPKFIARYYKRAKSWHENAVKKAQDDFEQGKSWTRYSPGSSVTSVSFDSITGPGLAITLVAGLSSIVLFVIALAAVTELDWLKIWLAPKLYLIEYAASLVK